MKATKWFLKYAAVIIAVLSIFAFYSCGKTAFDEEIILPLEEENVSDDIKGEEREMKLYIDDKEIPVVWENNPSVDEIRKDAEKGTITVSMNMYGGNEQFGSLGKTYISSDKQTVTHNGDIVLYNSSNIVLFYGSNSWSYTRLGKMDLEESAVTEILSKGNVTVKLKME